MNDQIEEVIRAANFLRGLWLDPAVPGHAKDAIMSTAMRLEAVADQFETLNNLYEELKYRMDGLEK